MIMRLFTACISIAVLSIVISPGEAGAQWVRDGNPVCTAGADQYLTDIIGDGTGGIIVVWTDERGGEYEEDIYAQRIDASGNPMWGADGIPLCTAPGYQVRAWLVSDCEGGVIVVWGDERDGELRPYAQRIDGSGAALWAPGGVPVGTDTNSGYPDAVSDGGGGAIVALKSDAGLYVLQIGPAGVPLWDPGGVQLTTVTADKDISVPALASDGAGGAIVTWQEYYENHYNRVVAQHVSASGTPGWVCELSQSSYYFYCNCPSIVGDDTGGSFLS
jgi:hypothetical protein